MINEQEDDLNQLNDLTDLPPLPEEDLSPPEEEDAALGNEDFYRNLVDDFEEGDLSSLSNHLIDLIKQDELSRTPWLDSFEKIKKALGFDLESSTSDKDFKNATKTYDNTFANSVLRLWCICTSELLHPKTPTSSYIYGQTTEELELLAEKKAAFFNYYYTVKEKYAYTDMRQMILYFLLIGDVFTKVWREGEGGDVKRQFIRPNNILIDTDCISLSDSSRYTHILELTKREILLKQQAGIYRKIKLSYLSNTGSNKSIETNYREKLSQVASDSNRAPSIFPIYEIHIYLNLGDFITSNNQFNDDEIEIPLPYIITIDRTDEKVLSIVRNWKPEDKLRKRRQFFIRYQCFSGFGPFGLGLGHIMGINAINLTMMIRQLQDAAKFANMPAGFKVGKISGQQSNDLVIGPGQFINIPQTDITGASLKDTFMPLPYSGPSMPLFELYKYSVQESKEIGSTAELGMMQSREDIPTGTALAFLERANIQQAAVLRSLHLGFTEELRLLNEFFSETIEYESFTFGEKKYDIRGEEFAREEVRIIPISDPSSNSKIQKAMMGEAVLNLALKAPELHNMPAVFEYVYKQQGLEEELIKKIIKPPESQPLPLDPISENSNILQNKPAKAANWQYHPGHIYSHGNFANQFPEKKPEIMAHIQEHQAMQYVLEQQQALGIELPPLEQLQQPEIQNEIAMAVSELAPAASPNEEGDQKQVTPEMVAMMDLQQQEKLLEVKKAEIETKQRIAEMQIERDMYKTQMQVIIDQLKIQNEKDMAQAKTEIEILKQAMNSDINELKANIELLKEVMSIESKSDQPIQPITLPEVM